MEKQISVGNFSYRVQFPEKCPLCHHYGDFSAHRSHELSGHSGVEILFECPYQGCKRYFIGYYGPKGQSELLGVEPQNVQPPVFSEAISNLSPQFVSIYEEAEEARHRSLTQICGAGYRKAFEFLIKDYAKSLSPDKEDEIENTFAGKVVSEFVADPRIQAVSKRALWLGNDETHYLRKWADRDINDLLVLIQLSINWIEIERLSAEYSDEMLD